MGIKWAYCGHGKKKEVSKWKTKENALALCFKCSVYFQLGKQQVSQTTQNSLFCEISLGSSPHLPFES